MSRAYRFLQAPGGRCHQQHTSFPQGSTSGTGRLPLHRHRVAAVISSTQVFLKAAQAARGGCPCTGTEWPPSSAALAAPAVRTSSKGQLLLPVHMPSQSGTRRTRGLQHQQPRTACCCAKALAWWSKHHLTQKVLAQQSTQPHAGGHTCRKALRKCTVPPKPRHAGILSTPEAQVFPQKHAAPCGGGVGPHAGCTALLRLEGHKGAHRQRIPLLRLLGIDGRVEGQQLGVHLQHLQARRETWQGRS